MSCNFPDFAALNPGYGHHMITYTWRDGCWRDRRTGEPMALPDGDAISAPRVQRDIAEYRSPIDGRPITSRSERREDLRRNGCVEVDPPRRPRGYRNARFAAPRGLRLNEDAG
jgi:hypothetical protein